MVAAHLVAVGLPAFCGLVVYGAVGLFGQDTVERWFSVSLSLVVTLFVVNALVNRSLGTPSTLQFWRWPRAVRAAAHDRRIAVRLIINLAAGGAIGIWCGAQISGWKHYIVVAVIAAFGLVFTFMASPLVAKPSKAPS